LEEEVVLADHKEVGKWVVHLELSYSCVHSKPIHLLSSENKILIREIKVKNPYLSNPLLCSYLARVGLA
jgi:hypothetical protein